MWKEPKSLAEVIERYNLESKHNGIIGIYKGIKFEPKSKADIKPRNKGIKYLASRQKTLGSKVDTGYLS